MVKKISKKLGKLRIIVKPVDLLPLNMAVLNKQANELGIHVLMLRQGSQELIVLAHNQNTRIPCILTA